MTTAAAQRGTVYKCAMCRHCDWEITNWTGRWVHTASASMYCGQEESKPND